VIDARDGDGVDAAVDVVDDAHRKRVHESTDRALVEQARVLKRLMDAGTDLDSLAEYAAGLSMDDLDHRMTAHEDAAAHLAKATEYLEAAELAKYVGLHNPATSNAVISGINFKNAICLQHTGRTGTTGNHAEDIVEVTAAGPTGMAQAATFDQLLRATSGSDAGQAIEWAGQLLTAAKSVMA
jgi:hypothetical protein